MATSAPAAPKAKAKAPAKAPAAKSAPAKASAPQGQRQGDVPPPAPPAPSIVVPTVEQVIKRGYERSVAEHIVEREKKKFDAQKVNPSLTLQELEAVANGVPPPAANPPPPEQIPGEVETVPVGHKPPAAPAKPADQVQVVDMEQAVDQQAQVADRQTGAKFIFNNVTVFKFTDGTKYHVRRQRDYITDPTVIANLREAAKDPLNRIFEEQ